MMVMSYVLIACWKDIGENDMTERELNEMIDWCRKKMSNLPFNYTGKRKEGYKDAMLQIMSYLHSRKGSDE